MNTFTVTATDLRKNAADILNRVYYEKKIALIERAGKVIVRMHPSNTDAPHESFLDVWNRSAGSMPDFPDVKKFRRDKRHWPAI
ncbi:MAG: hypothetical protein Q8L37_03210 [Candidatus Gottesmanbacteria bacterium]|nr:hypothetical protein [Candidatus Gottesmanbacteria bacterium]